MSPTKLPIGQIVVVYAIVVLGIWFVTQWAAARLAYQAEFGRPWFILFHLAIYSVLGDFPMVVLVRCLCTRHFQ